MTHRDIAALLRAHGHRVTQPRVAVWQALARGGHLTVEEIADRVWQRRPEVNLASVYRSLALFADLDLARESRLGGEPARWELAHPDEHFHLVCEGCRRVEHHVGSLVEQVRVHLRAEHGFATRTVELTVSGLCARCTAAGADTGGALADDGRRR